MHRDEVRIFRGSADDHFRRLTLFARDVRTMVPLDDESPPATTSSLGWLECPLHQMNTSSRSSRFDLLRLGLSDSFGISLLLLISVLIALVVAQESIPILQFGTALLICPALWVLFRCVSILKDREPHLRLTPTDPFAIPHRKNAAEWLLWLMLLPLVPIARLIDRWSRRR